MKLFDAEIRDGLGDIISSNNKISVAGMLRPFSLPAKHPDHIPNLSISSKYDTNTLYLVYAILASTGFNLNDDYFLPEEVWAAKNTPEDKPFNLEHNPNQIIGHITSSYPVDEQYAKLDSDGAVPDKFHLLTEAVIYKHFGKDDDDLVEAVSKLITEIEEDKWCVSMEAIFPRFDYVLVEDNTEAQFVERNEATAFLTKHLRIYGGTGVYNSRRVGRVLRDITFAGKGLVKTPANPESVIINRKDIANYSNRVFSSILKPRFGEENGDMSENTQVLEQKIAELKAENKSLADKLAKVDVEKLEAKIAEANQALASKTEEVGNISKAKTEVEEKVAAMQSEYDSLKKLYDESQAKLNETTKAVEAMKAEARKQSRVSMAVAKGLDTEKAEALVAKFDNLSDEQFTAITDMIPAKAEIVVEAPEDDNVDSKGESVASQTDTGVEPVTEPEPEMSIQGEDAQAQVREGLSKALATLLVPENKKRREVQTEE